MAIRITFFCFNQFNFSILVLYQQNKSVYKHVSIRYNMFMSAIRKFTYFLLILAIVGSVSLYFYKKSDALGFGASSLPFGGVTTYQPNVICTNGQYLTINGSSFLLPFTAKRYAWGLIPPYAKIWTLGLYTPGGVCVQPYPLPSLPVKGSIKMLGNSLP